MIKLFRNFRVTESKLTSENFETDIDVPIDVDGFVSEASRDKLIMINKYFPFNMVKGVYNSEEGLDLLFDNGVSIVGDNAEEPFIAEFRVNWNVYLFGEHPFGGFGGLDSEAYEENIREIHKEENMFSR